MNSELYLGDCLDILPTLPDGSVSAVICDPPYGINTKSDGKGKFNPWADRVNAARWYREWFAEARRLLTDSGCFLAFLNWRSIVTYQKAAADLGWPMESLVIWDKCSLGVGTMRGFRPSYEMIALWAMPDFYIADRRIADIYRCKWTGHKPSGHPAEKPVSLLKFLVENVTNPNDTVVDAFMGSGTTGIACVQSGRKFIGIEMDERYYKIARQRIEEAHGQVT